MPELPEVETIRRGLKSRIIGKKIAKVEVKKTRLIRSRLADFYDILADNQIKNIDRIGKLLIFELRDRHYLLVHLKMTGQLIYSYDNRQLIGGHNLPVDDNLPNKYSHIIFYFADDSRLFFNDLRQFGYMQIVSSKERAKLSEQYGPEPGKLDFDLPNFGRIFAGRTALVKSILLNQQLIAGIGNIYADEIAFRAKVLPDRPADSLSREEIRRLYQAAQYIIKKAIAKQGTTFSNYRDSNNQKGNYSSFLKVYGRAGKKCLRCRQGIIKKIKLNGRGTHFCPVCQK